MTAQRGKHRECLQAIPGRHLVSSTMRTIVEIKIGNQIEQRGCLEYTR